MSLGSRFYKCHETVTEQTFSRKSCLKNCKKINPLIYMSLFSRHVHGRYSYCKVTGTIHIQGHTSWGRRWDPQKADLQDGWVHRAIQLWVDDVRAGRDVVKVMKLKSLFSADVWEQQEPFLMFLQLAERLDCLPQLGVSFVHQPAVRAGPAPVRVGMPAPRPRPHGNANDRRGERHLQRSPPTDEPRCHAMSNVCLCPSCSSNQRIRCEYE